MITTTETRNPNALEQVFAEADKIIAAMAAVGEEELRRNISAGARSGVHYPNEPRRSSAPGEYSQEQEGTMVRRVAHGQSAPLEHWFGLDPQNQAEAEAFLAQELGAPRNNLKARANVRKTGSDPGTHAKMIAASRR